MSLLAAQRVERPPLALFGERSAGDDGVGGEPTLDGVIVGAWEGLAAQVAVACPLCAEGVLRPLARGSAAAAAERAVAELSGGGACDGCGATLF